MLEAGIWGLLGSSSLLIGAAIGTSVSLHKRELGLLMGFGAGTLISALAFELTEEAFALGGADTVAAEGTGPVLLLGAILDGIPECAVLGIAILESGGVAVPLLAAVFLSNLPEAISSAAGMGNHSRREVLALWGAVVAGCALAAALGFLLLDGASGELVGFVQAFAGGAVLMTVADAMLPEAQRLGGKAVGLATVLGFALAYLLSTLG